MAGSWSGLSIRQGSVNGHDSYPIGLVKEFTGDAADGTVPAKELIKNVSGYIVGFDVELLDPAPDSVTVATETVGDVPLPDAGGTVAASGRIPVDPPVPVAGGLKLTISGNTVAGAKANIVTLVIPVTK